MAKIQVTDNADAKKKAKSAKTAVKKSANSSTSKKSTKRVSVDTTSVTPKKIKRIKVEKAEKKAPKKPVKAKVTKAEPKKTEIKVEKAKKETKKAIEHTSSKAAISSNNAHSVLQKSTTLSRRYVKRPENEAVVDIADNKSDEAAKIDVAEAIISPETAAEAAIETEATAKTEAEAAKEAGLSPEAALDAILEEATQKAEEAKAEAIIEAEAAKEEAAEAAATEKEIAEEKAAEEQTTVEAAEENTAEVKAAEEAATEDVQTSEEKADTGIKVSIGKSSVDAKTEKARKAQAKKERQAMKLAKAQTKLAEKRARAEAEAARKAQIRAERMAKRQARIAMPAIKAGAKAGSTRDRALRSAMRSVATMNTGDTPKEMHREFRKKRKGGRIVLALLCSAATVAALVAFVNFNMPDISVRVAAMQTGIDASYPSIIPRGYTLSNVSSDKDGQIAMVFKNSDDNSFTLTEEKSTWDSNALLNNYVKKVMTSEYTTMREQGITIYTEGDSATWVNGGILFKVKASGKYLTKEQIRNLATSV